METHILVVEDETKIARVLKMELEYEGYQVTVEHDGKTGLETALQTDIASGGKASITGILILISGIACLRLV